MDLNQEEVRQRARERLNRWWPGQGARILDAFIEAEMEGKVVDLDWYLREKIVGPPEEEEAKDHVRALRYARNFVKAGAAKVTFLRETPNPTPDLFVEVDGLEFYVEVTKFRETKREESRMEKITDRISDKLRQFVSGAINFVAIENFDLGLESTEDGGLTHEKIAEAFEEIERLASEGSASYKKLSGIIYSAQNTGGVGTGEPGRNWGIPEYVWVNESAVPTVSAELEKWVIEALPGGEKYQRIPAPGELFPATGT